MKSLSSQLGMALDSPDEWKYASSEVNIHVCSFSRCFTYLLYPNYSVEVLLALVLCLENFSPLIRFFWNTAIFKFTAAFIFGIFFLNDHLTLVRYTLLPHRTATLDWIGQYIVISTNKGKYKKFHSNGNKIDSFIKLELLKKSE